jgi:hypothetical protein
VPAVVQYVLYGPLVSKAVASRAGVWEAANPDRWILLLLLLFGPRALTYQLWSSFSNMLFATRRRRVVRDGVDFGQIDKEWDWYVRTVQRPIIGATDRLWPDQTPVCLSVCRRTCC